jgi:hypothetical protein
LKGDAMRVEAKSALILAVTLALGAVLGGLAAGALQNRRTAELAETRRPRGFAGRMEEIIRPHSPAQWDSLRPFVDAAARNNDEALDAANARIRAGFDSMQVRMVPLLDEAQRERLAEFVRTAPLLRHPAPGRKGPPPHRGPHGEYGPPPHGPPPHGPPP